MTSIRRREDLRSREAVVLLSRAQARVAIIAIAKLAKVSLDLLAIFVAHYYSEAGAEKVAYLVKEQFD